MVEQNANSNQRMVLKLAGVVLAMFAFGYALVPLYDVFCEITGIGGKTGRTTASAAAVEPVDKSRLITVQFTGTRTVGLPWDFGPVTRTVKLHPGEIGEATYFAKNLSTRRVVGQAVPQRCSTTCSSPFQEDGMFLFCKSAT